MNRKTSHLSATETIRNGLDIGIFEYSVNISPLHNYMFVEVPKVGCSSIKATLQKFEWGKPEFEFEAFEDVHQREFSPLLFPRQLVDFSERINSGCWFQFGFVREPFGRLLSVYLDKMCSPSVQRNRLLKHIAKSKELKGPEISFETFVYAIAAQNFAEMDNHWKPQNQLLCSDTICYDFIGRMEAFDKDFGTVLSKIGADDSYITALAPHKTGSRERLQEFYTPELIELVAAKYLKDFEIYGYPTTID